MIYDVGCGFGAFLEYCRSRDRPAVGLDSNPKLVEICNRKGLQAYQADVLNLHEVFSPADNIICDNVIEHLSLIEVDRFFCEIQKIWSPGGVMLIVVPNQRGYGSDPTHKTFVDDTLIAEITNKFKLSFCRTYLHPIPWRILGDHYIFNMSVFRIENS